MNAIQLFDEVSIGVFLDERENLIRGDLRSRLSEILSKDPASLAAEIAKKYQLTIPKFDFSKTTNKVETYPERYGTSIVPIDYVIYEIPYSGSSELLRCSPNRANCRIGYNLTVTDYGNKIGFGINSQGSVATPGQPRDRVNNHGRAVMDYINCSINALTNEVTVWNDNLEEALREGLQATRQRMEEERQKIQSMEDDLNPFTK